MRKLISFTLVLLACSTLSAQYKKASFFGKAGRTYELGAQMYAMGDGKGSPIGYKIGFGSDQDGKRFFYSWDIQLIPAYDYTYNTQNEMGDAITVNGKSKLTVIYGMNYSFHLLNNEGEKKLRPYVSLGVNAVLAGGAKSETWSPDITYSYLNKRTADQGFTGGVGGGLGCLVNFTPTIGLKLQGGYSYQFQITNKDPGVDYYHMFTSHPYVSAGIRLRFAAE